MSKFCAALNFKFKFFTYLF